MLAGLTILAMFSFVFLGVISDLISNRSVQNPVAVRTSKYGKLTVRDLRYMGEHRMRLYRVLGRIRTQAMGYNPLFAIQLMENYFGTVNEENLVSDWLMARRAEEIGMVISNKTINEYLHGFSLDRLTSQDISAIIKQQGFSVNQFFEDMRDFIRVREISRLFLESLAGITPAQRWHYFCQLHKQATVELIPLAVEQFLAQVTDPKEEELKEYFEQYKDKLPRPDSPEPGFRTPEMIDVEYFKADIAKFSAPDAFTEAEIQDCYEKNRAEFEQTEKQSESSVKPEEKAEPAKETQKETEAKPDKVAAKPGESPGTNRSESAGEKAEASKRSLSESVREKVRARLAREKISKIFAGLRQEMEENGTKWRKYEAQKIHKQAATPPEKLDLEALSKKYGVSTYRTGLVSNWESLKHDIGSSRVEGGTQFVDVAFKAMGTFRTERSIDVQGNEYLFWKINETPESTPKFEDEGVREQVLYAWKLSRARDLALKHAEQLAQTAIKDNVSLKEIFGNQADVKVLAPPAFTMLTEGNVPIGSSRTALRYSEIEGAPMAGGDFMRAVFDLEEKQIGVGMNIPKTMVYVIRLDNYSPPQDVLWQIFLVDDFSKYAAAAQNDFYQAQVAWLEDLKTSAGLKWELRPTERRAQQPAEGDYEE